MPQTNRDTRLGEIEAQEGVSEETKQQQATTVAEAFGPDTKVAVSNRVRRANDDDDGTVLSREELLAAARSFDVMPETIAGALHLAGKDKMTRTQMREAIARFEGMEVSR